LSGRGHGGDRRSDPVGARDDHREARCDRDPRSTPTSAAPPPWTPSRPRSWLPRAPDPAHTSHPTSRSSAPQRPR